MGEHPPAIPLSGLTFKQWHLGKIYPTTKSLNINYSSYYQQLGCVRDILGGITAAHQHVDGTQRQRASGVQTKIVSHHLQYLWEKLLPLPVEVKNVVWLVQGDLV
jgi:hypothetical protein